MVRSFGQSIQGIKAVDEMYLAALAFCLARYNLA